MITVPFTELAAEQNTTVWVLEFSTEYGEILVSEEADVIAHPSSGKVIESCQTGGWYSDPRLVDEVELFDADQHYLAVFPDEEAMQDGAASLAHTMADEISASLAASFLALSA